MFSIHILKSFLNVHLLTLVISCTVLPACATSQTERSSQEWQLIDEDPNSPFNWSTYSRRVVGTPYREFKLSGVLNLSPERAVEVLKERTINSEKYVSPEEGYMHVVSHAENELVIFSVFNMPFPFRDRAMCERFTFSHDPLLKQHTIAWREDWQACAPLEEGVIAMPVARGSWTFVAQGQNKSLATYIVHVHPGGRVPAWLSNLGVAQGLPMEFKKIAETAYYPN